MRLQQPRTLLKKVPNRLVSDAIIAPSSEISSIFLIFLEVAQANYRGLEKSRKSLNR